MHYSRYVGLSLSSHELPIFLFILWPSFVVGVCLGFFFVLFFLFCFVFNIRSFHVIMNAFFFVINYRAFLVNKSYVSLMICFVILFD